MGSEISHCAATCTHAQGKENEAILIEETSTTKKTHKSIDPDFVKKTTMDQTNDHIQDAPRIENVQNIQIVSFRDVKARSITTRGYRF